MGKLLDDMVTSDLIPNETNGFRSVLIEEPLTDIEGRILLIQKNETDKPLFIKMEIKPGMRIVVKEDGIPMETNGIGLNQGFTIPLNSNNIDITTQESNNTDKHGHNKINDWLLKFNEQFKEDTHNINQMEIVISKKDKEIEKLILDKECMEGGICMLKPNNFKLVPRSILIYIIIVAMMFCFFLTCFILYIFSNINIMHPFLSFTLTIGSLGLLLTARESINDVKNTYLKILNNEDKK